MNLRGQTLIHTGSKTRQDHLRSQRPVAILDNMFR